MPEDTCSSRPYSKRLFRVDDGSETSDTTGSRETREQQSEECEVEVVKMDTSEVVVAQGGAVESCDVMGTSSKLAFRSSNKNGPYNEDTEEVPDRQKSAMQAFLASPTGLNWDDLVRSMREEMFIKTVTINRQQSDDDSSIGSLGSSNGDNRSTGSMNSSLSSKSAFLRRTRSRTKVKGGPGRRNRRKKESLEKKIERVVLSSSDRKKKSYQDESHPLLTKSKVAGGKRCAFPAVTKLPATPSSPNTPLSESDNDVMSPPTIERESWFKPVEQPPTQYDSSEVVTPQPFEARRSEMTKSTKATQDPPLLLKMSISADSDEDSFYYHIRGKPTSKAESASRAKSGSSFKTKGHRNPYAFSNHRLLPAVVEEGHIAPFPTTFDELDSKEEPLKYEEEDQDTLLEDTDEPAGRALGSFAASIGKAEPTSSLSRLQMYKSPSRTRRRRSFWQIFAPCCTRTKAEI